ncbi:MAG: hotdog fold thioesterase [Anaerolineales bacterium]|nr:hotdog fold thioesterase [Anaerolineales bacterium]
MKKDERILAHIEQDTFANWLGTRIEELRTGYSRVSLTIQPTMTNFHGTTHGGVVFGLADVAFAAASNSRGQTAVALNMTISYLQATSVGDQLVAEAQEQHQGGPIALYDITVTRQPGGEPVAKLQAMVYRKKEWFVSGNQ